MGETNYRNFLENIRNTTKKYKIAFWATIKEALVLENSVVSAGVDTVIESGTCHGFTSCWLASLDNVKKIHTFDPVNRQKLWDDFSELKDLKQKIYFHQAKFHDGIGDLKFSSKKNLYFFIDGDHSYQGVKRDFEAIEPLLSFGDKIMFHDSHTEAAVIRYLSDFRKQKWNWRYREFYTERGMTEFTVE